MTKPRSKRDISISGVLHERLRLHAQKSGEHVGTLVDAICRAWLDRQGGQP